MHNLYVGEGWCPGRDSLVRLQSWEPIGKLHGTEGWYAWCHSGGGGLRLWT
jgi:hypothetical protein